ncbi:hypothetical protein GCM10011529_23910 [Polymorphobacter glacialis]|uniref:Uncharacterized protein n=2 Tax=Sandarakinorhabdus glacialis TaxID=1614636 RepID=A0A916ZW69_9SPHN|nr:hypothetical protein GCM10011529_23910 [Polymorphobacter glacialis]
MISHLIGLVLAASPVAPPMPDSEPITVTAPRIDPATVAPAARAYVKGVLPTPVSGQYARWLGPVCIKVIGLEAPLADRISSRITVIARESRVPVAAAGCQPNLVVWFSGDARRDVAAILGKKPLSGKDISAENRRRLLDAPLPVRWWHTVQAGSSDGTGMSTTPSAKSTAQFIGSDNAGTGVGGPTASSTATYSSSLIDTHLSVGIVYAAAAVDVPLTQGQTLESVANYVAMVTLAPIPLDVAAPAVPSILGLFAAAPTAAETQLSPWDKAYLAALYRMSPNRRASSQKGQLVAAIPKTLKP